MNSPATVLHVCLGNICRSPMAERLFALRFAEAVETRYGGVRAQMREESQGDEVGSLLSSRSAGVGNWYVGEDMNPPAATQLRARKADTDGYSVRTLNDEIVTSAALLVTAEGSHVNHIRGHWPDAISRTFPLKEFARLVSKINKSELPPLNDDSRLSAEAVAERLAALVEEADNVRLGLDPARIPDPADDVDDPYQRGDAYFSRIADEIDAAVQEIVNVLVPPRR